MFFEIFILENFKSTLKTELIKSMRLLNFWCDINLLFKEKFSSKFVFLMINLELAVNSKTFLAKIN